MRTGSGAPARRHAASDGSRRMRRDADERPHQTIDAGTIAFTRRTSVLRKLALIAIGIAFVSGQAVIGADGTQAAAATIAAAQKALGDVKSITYSGSAKDVSFQQCGANS